MFKGPGERRDSLASHTVTTCECYKYGRVQGSAPYDLPYLAVRESDRDDVSLYLLYHPNSFQLYGTSPVNLQILALPVALPVGSSPTISRARGRGDINTEVFSAVPSALRHAQKGTPSRRRS